MVAWFRFICCSVKAIKAPRDAFMCHISVAHIPQANKCTYFMTAIIILDSVLPICATDIVINSKPADIRCDRKNVAHCEPTLLNVFP